MKEEYRKTDIGDIPDNWCIRKLEDITLVITKGTTPTTYGYDFVEEGVNFIKIESINDVNGTLVENTFSKITEECHKKLARSILQDEDILFAIAGATVGKCALVNKENLPANTNQALAIIRIDNNVNRRFIFHQLRSQIIQDKITNLKTNTAQPNLNLNQIGNFQVVVPPLKEQQKIAEILSTVDAQIDDTDKLIEKTKELKKGLMQRLLTKGIGHTEFKMTEIGDIPVEWEVEILNNISDVRDGTHDSPKYVEQGNPFITSKNLKEHGIDFSDINYISNEDHEKFSQRSNVDNGDILFGMIGTIGNPVIVKKEFEFSIKNVALIKFNDNNISNTFLLNILKSNLIEKQFEKLSNGGVQKFIALGMIRNLLIPVPSVEEQQKIANILSAVDIQIEEYQNKKIKLEEFKKGLMQQLLTGKIRVF